jgi:hypothetical protein
MRLRHTRRDPSTPPRIRAAQHPCGSIGTLQARTTSISSTPFTASTPWSKTGCAPRRTGIRNLPFHGYERNQAWLLAANLASDLIAYLQLLGLETEQEPAAAEPAHHERKRCETGFRRQPNSQLKV